MTIQELEQAVLISPDDLDGTIRVQGHLNIVRLCGPIVEEVDDYVQFVHFSAKE